MVLAGATYVVAWVAFWELAAAAALTSGTSVWYPPAALTFGLLAIFGPMWAWLPLIASLIAGQQLWQGSPTIFELAGSLTHVASYAIAACFFRRLTPSPRFRLTPRRFSLFVLAGMSGAALSAALGALNHELAGLEAAQPIGPRLIAWFAGDALGVVSLAPFLVFAAFPWHRRLLQPRHLRRLGRPGRLLLIDVATVAGMTGAAGLTGWVARVHVVPISALAAAGTMILLTGKRPARQSLATMAFVFTGIALASLALPERKALVEGGLVLLMGALLTSFTLHRTLLLRREQMQLTGLKGEIARIRGEYETTAQQLARMRTRIAEMGHELRTPLNAVMGYAGIIRMTASQRADDRTAEHAATIERSGEFLSILINDVVDSASLRRDRLSLQIQPTDPGEVLDAVASMLAHRAAAKSQTLEPDLATDIPPVAADPVRLKQVLVNLTQNAIKYSPKETPITLAARQESAETVRLSVIDSGPGLSDEELEIALQPFRRAGTAETEAGSGIGLPLALELARKMGGTADIDTAPGEGTGVHVRLPVTAYRANFS